MKVLMADDEPAIRDFFQHFLSRELPDAQVRTAPCGGAALAIADDWLPDIIVSDIAMIPIDGFQFLRAVRCHPKLARVPFILFTAAKDLEPSEVECALKAGADRILWKVEYREILSAIKELTNKEVPCLNA